MITLATPNGDKQIMQVAAQPSQAWTMPRFDTLTGRSVTAEDALGISAFYAGANLISKTIGTMPLRTYERGVQAAIEVDPRRADIALRLRHQPNIDMSAALLWTTIAAHLVIAGNAYLAKVYERGSFAPHLYIVRPDTVHPFRAEDGRKLFYVTPRQGKAVTLSPSSLLHIPGVCFGDGLVGHNPVSAMRHRLGVAAAASEHQQRFFKNGAQFQGILSVEDSLTVETAQVIADQWQANHAGADNAYKTPVLDHGAKYQPISMSNDDAQFIEQMKMGATEIASMLNIPPAMIGAEGASLTYANAQHNDLHFAKFTIRPWLRMIEQALNNDPDLFGPRSPWEPMFDVDDLVRPDALTRWQIHKIASEIDAVTTDEIRTEEGRAPLQVIEGGAA